MVLLAAAALGLFALHMSGLYAKPGALPPALIALGETGLAYFKILAAGSRSVHRETLRLTFLVEVFGAIATQSAMREVMQTGHVGAEYLSLIHI